MIFVFSKVFWFVAQPGNLLLMLLCLGVLLLWSGRYRSGQTLVSLVAIALLAVAVLPVADWVATPLEDRFPAPGALPERVDGIIQLGGATQPNITAARGQPTINESGERFLAFVELARRFPEARLAFSGGSGSLFPARMMEAEVARLIFAGLGLDLARITFDDGARNTFENVRNLRELLAPEPGESWVLVTSARHMPRAVGIFRKAGWPVVPYPVDYITTGDSGAKMRFNLSHELKTLTLASREWIGLLAYFLMERTSSLYPGPEDAAS